ncbi:Na+-driven multidrug efflux pump, partial [human gut metagenome]
KNPYADYQILNLVTFVVTQLAMGVTVLIARYFGEKRPEQISAVLGGAAVVFTILSVGIFILLVGFARPISVLMQAPEEAVGLTVSYVRICGGGIFFVVAYNLLSAIFRGLGDSRSPLLFVLVASLVNIAGDLILVAGFGMDAAGAAIATVLAQATEYLPHGAASRRPASGLNFRQGMSPPRASVGGSHGSAAQSRCWCECASSVRWENRSRSASP